MHHDYQERLTQIWRDAGTRYQDGHTSPQGFLSEDELGFIASLGMNAMDVFDFAEVDDRKSCGAAGDRTEDGPYDLVRPTEARHGG